MPTGTEPALRQDLGALPFFTRSTPEDQARAGRLVLGALACWPARELPRVSEKESWGSLG